MSLFGRCYLGMSIKPSPAALLCRPRFKIGITRRELDKRFNEIDRSIVGSVEFPLFAAWGLWPEGIEGALHRAWRKHRRAHRGSGRTEWFSPPRLMAIPFLVANGIALLLWFILSLAAALGAVGGIILALLYFFT